MKDEASTLVPKDAKVELKSDDLPAGNTLSKQSSTQVKGVNSNQSLIKEAFGQAKPMDSQDVIPEAKEEITNDVPHLNQID